ncbi:hypothetical protein Glove_348g24 [Diversispora epigaea]|uniref:DUF1740-domain-containing protein n=1 Tax=Diversispora epigaea TaxID=1348612 RepID=A0A397HIE5_9GLOM|nr:hypothetical protein Glove_348g24 [Diversispora epigaea]
MSLIPKESEIPSFSSFPDITPNQKNKKSLKSKKRDESEDEQSSDRGYNNNEYINKDYRPSKRTKKKKEKDHSRSSDDDRSVSNKKRGSDGSRYERNPPRKEHYLNFEERKRRYKENLFRALPEQSSSSTILEQEKKHEESSKPIEKIPKEFRHLNPFKPVKEKETKKKKKGSSKEQKKGKEKSKLVDSMNEQEEISEEFIREKIKYFNVQLDLNPYDINLWLEFIEFQEKNSQFGKSKKADAADIRLSINEVKLSIFERALEVNPNNPTLLSAYMKCCEQIWDVPKLLTKWDQILKENSRNIILWMQYLNFRQTNLVSFTVSQCIQVFEDCLHLLRKETLITFDPNEKLKLERIMIHIFHRACFFMYQSGYTERAYSCWQAIMELVLFVPENLQNLDFYDRLIKFESFWEAEWPRFGEDGAKGWSYYEKKVSEDEPHDTTFLNISQNIPSNISHEGDIYEKWVNSENIHDTELLSIRTSDELEIEDPYRVTLFDDIRTFLFDLTSPQSRKELIYACFAFAGFTFNPGYSSSNPLITDTFLNVKIANESIANTNFWMTTDSTNIITKTIKTTSTEMTRINDYGFKFPVKTFPPDGSNIFPSQNWFSVFDEKIDIMGVNIKFVRNVIYQLQQTEIDKDIKLCMLLIEYLFDVSSDRNLTKNIIKQDQMNLALWNGFAQGELLSNKISEARKVYLGALTQYRTFPIQFRYDAPLLHLTFAEMEIEQGNLKTAMNILVNLTEEQGTIDSISEIDVPITKLLRARKYYSQQIVRVTDPSASQKNFLNSLHYHVCYALMECLSRNIQQACKIFEEMLETFEIKPENVDHGKLLREVLDRALKLFPNNTIFLFLYFREETRGRIPLGLQKFLKESLKKIPTHILWTVAIYDELHRQQPYNIDRIRSLFYKSLECFTTKNSISLWSLFIHFEINHGELYRAKTLYYRAIRECPWSKDLYMIAFRELKSQFKTEELDEIMNVILEKEIRIRIPIENFIITTITTDNNNNTASTNETETETKLNFTE